MSLRSKSIQRATCDKPANRPAGPGRVAVRSIQALPRFAILLILLALTGFSQRSIAAQTVQFARDILPLLSDNCFACHGPDDKARKGKLRLDTREGALAVREGKAILIPGKSGESELYRRLVTRDEDDLMPPKKFNHPLSSEQIEKVRIWIDQGATWTEHWAFEKIRSPFAAKDQRQASTFSNPIDFWVASRLTREGLDFSAEAPRHTLARRVTLDLTGLPPSPDEVSRFVNDSRPDAYERLVDRLLKSPAFGERMAWDWLEASRYADSNGYQGDGERTMWPWRDWVVQAFNRDLPFDQFTTWQLAGDRLQNPTEEQRMATGFCRNHAINGEGGRIPEENRVDYVMDMTETVGTVWLGLTFNCCRCHDHKFDPLTRRDYYSLSAFFNQTPVDGSGGDPQSKPHLELPTTSQKDQLLRLEDSIKSQAAKLDALEMEMFPRAVGETADKSSAAASFPDAIKSILKTNPARRGRNQLADLEKETGKPLPKIAAHAKALREAVDERDRISRSITRVMVMEDMPSPRKTYLLDKGIYDKRGDEVTAALPARLAAAGSGLAVSNRLDLANWITSRENPLTARVTVNRIWQTFFGTGLVKTPEDFGLQGARPVHPELLDFLASELIRSGWSLKHVCRLILTSQTYKQSSSTSPALREKDPENSLLARGARFRMPSWMIRDQALAVSGLISLRQGGPPTRPYQPPGIWEDATFGAKKYEQDKGEGLYRRSLYTFWRRIIGPTQFFDTAPRQVCTVKPLRTNSPLHALVTLDDPTFVEASRALAQEALTRGGRSNEDRIRWLYLRVLCRAPMNEELDVTKKSLDRLVSEFAANRADATKLLAVGDSKPAESLDPVEHAAYTGLCSILLNLDETLTHE